MGAVPAKSARVALLEIGAMPMVVTILFAAAAVATIAGFILEAWREMKSRSNAEDEGRQPKDQR